MGDMRPVARIYLVSCYVLGVAACWFMLQGSPGSGTIGDWLTAAVLGTLAATAQVFNVQRSKKSYADHLTPAPLIAAFLLLPAAPLIVVVAMAFVPEWIVYRRTWYVQSFNISSWWIAIAMGRLLLIVASGQTHLGGGSAISPVVT